MVDLSAGKSRLGGSILAQVYGQMGREVPDLDAPERLKSFFAVAMPFRQGGVMLAVAWNASVWGATFGVLARGWSEGGGPDVLEAGARLDAAGKMTPLRRQLFGMEPLYSERRASPTAVDGVWVSRQEMEPKA